MLAIVMRLACFSRHSHNGATGCPIRPWALLLLSAALFGCVSKQSVGGLTILGPGIINDPKNKTLRLDILKYGLDSFCGEMLTRGVTLKLSDDHPVAGRFFARDCRADMLEDDSKTTFNVKLSGSGYVWSNVTRRVGFELTGSIVLLPDFQIAEDKSMYVYFRSQHVETTQMKVSLVESSVARSAAQLAGLDADRVSREIFEAQVSRGFTVIRTNESGQIEYAVGLLPLGKRPFHPFAVVSSDPTLANDRTEVHTGQQDYIGGFVVEGNDKALSFALSVDGAPSVNIAVISSTAATSMLDRYIHFPGVTSFAEPPRYTQNVLFGSFFRQKVPVPAGSYVLLLEHAAGPTAPNSSNLPDDRAAKVDYLVQLVDAP